MIGEGRNYWRRSNDGRSGCGSTHEPERNERQETNDEETNDEETNDEQK